jgi:hypothetical protein
LRAREMNAVFVVNFERVMRRGEGSAGGAGCSIMARTGESAQCPGGCVKMGEQRCGGREEIA